MDYISTFTGIGGFDLAFNRAGMNCVGMCEKDEQAQALLQKRFPDIPLHDDVTTLGVDTYGRDTVDLVCGGFPCQDLSIAGKRAGLAGERSGLFFHLARIAYQYRARWFVGENVPGLLSSNEGRDFAVILGCLTGVFPAVPDGGWQNAGLAWGPKYKVAWRVLDAQYFGVPQRRRRVFIVGHLADGRAAEVLFESEGGTGHPPARQKEGKGFTGTFTISSGKDGGGKGYLGAEELGMTLGGQPQYAFDARNMVAGDKSSTLQSKKDGGYSLNYTPMVFEDQEAPEYLVMAHGQANAEILQDQVPTLNTNHEQPILWEMQHASEAYRESGDIAPTPQSRMGTGGNQFPMVGVRRLTPVECERLQGFPDDWTGGQADSTRYRQLGNAVAVPVVEWIGRRIMEVDAKAT